MTVTLEIIMDSVARCLQKGFKDIPVYAGKNQQGTAIPCFFISLMNPEIRQQPGGFWMRDIGLDVVYLQRRHELNGNLMLYRVQEWLDEHMGMIVLTDGSESAQVHTYEREASVQDQDLHYKFYLHIRVYVPGKEEVMKEMEAMDVNKKEK